MASKPAGLTGDLVAKKGLAQPSVRNEPPEVNSNATAPQNRKVTTIRLTDRQYKALRKTALEEGRPANDVIADAIDAYVRERFPEFLD